jgi:drug/metabolite transporter (DMT)-like permease
LLKLYHVKDNSAPIVVIFLGNYLCAALISLSLSVPVSGDLSFVEIVSGVVFGVLFIISFLTYQRNIRTNGVSLSVAIMRMSLLIPIIVSIAIFKDKLGLINIIGVMIVFSIFLLMGKLKGRANILWLFYLFLTVGCAETGMKVFKEIGKHSDNVFLLLVFTSATLIALTISLIQKKMIVSKYLLWGVLLGIPNQLTALFFMKSIEQIPAVVAYPTLAASVLVGSVASDALIWKSRFTRKEVMLLTLILIGVILINIK